MDPLATLEAADHCLTNREYEDCKEHLNNYWSWRYRGGFEPIRGDRYATWIGEQLGQAQSQCSRKFKTTKAAERASNDGCPKCDGVDIDLDDSPPAPSAKKLSAIRTVRAMLGMPFPEKD